MDLFKDVSWLYNDERKIVITIISTVIIYLVIIILTRLNGLRTFAKMSSFDFAITIAIGSIIATTMLSGTQSVLQGIIGLITLLCLQAVVALLRRKSKSVESLITNTPILLMDGSHIIEENLKATRVTQADLYAKLREANVTNKDQVLAVVLETTGDISVLHNGKNSDQLEEDILMNVQKLSYSNDR